MSVIDDDARAVWAEYRRAPFRRDLLAPLAARCARARTTAAADLLAADTPSARAAALADLLAAALVAEHLRDLQTSSVSPRMVALLVAAGELAPDDAADLLALTTADERIFVATLVPRLSPAALWPLVARLLAAPALLAHFDALGPALRRAAELDPARAVALLIPGHPLHLADLLPRLTGDPREAARAHVLSTLSQATGLFDQVDLLRRALPALTDADLGPLRRRHPDLPPDLAARGLPALREWLAPTLARDWARLAPRPDSPAPLDEWELRLDALGPLVTADDTRRWLAALVPALLADPQQSFRLQVGISGELADEAADRLDALPPEARCEALMWLARPHGGRIAARAMRTIAATDELPDDRRRWLLCALLPVLPAPERRRAAALVLADPACTLDDQLRAAAHLEGDRLRAAARDLLRAAPLDAPSPSPALAPALAVAPLAALAAELAGADRDAVLAGARRLMERSDRGAHWTSIRALAPLIGPADAARLAETALADPELPPRAHGAMLALVPERHVMPYLRAAADAMPPYLSLWHTLGELTFHLPDQGAALRRLYRERLAAGLAGPGEVVDIPPWTRDEGLWRAYAEHMRADPWRPYAGWLLGAAARELPEPERGPVLDAALAEFAHIVATPTSPGNDDGPFVELADLLSESQVRRALDLVAEMADHRWGVDLEHARLHLHLRLAALGHLDEAAAAIAGLSHPDLRPWGAGALAGARLVRGEPWSAVAPTLELDGPDQRHDTLAGLLWALEGELSPVPEDIIEGILALLPGVEPDLRGALVRQLGDLGLDPARWAAVARTHATAHRRVELLLELANTLTATDPTTARALAREALAFAEQDAVPADDIIADLLRAHSSLPPDQLTRWLTRWLIADTHRHLLADIEDTPFAPALHTLGGPPLVRAAADAILGTVDLLA